ncbi:hypothetical protein R6Q57_007021 [Mikania cordata]
MHVPYQSHQQDFWASADIDCEVEPPVIRGKVLGHDVIISAEHIRRVCGFQDTPDQPFLLDRYLVRGCFMRCKYEGDLGAGILNKAYMFPQFKYLAHMLIHCLGSRRGGFDDMRETIQPDYIAPVGRRWRHDDSDSEVEDIVVPDDDGDDGDGGEGGVGGGVSGVSVGVSSIVDVIVTTTGVSMVEAGALDVGAASVSTSAVVSTSVADYDDVDIDSLMDLDFMATTTSKVSTPLDMTGTTSAEDKDGSDESEDEGVRGCLDWGKTDEEEKETE